MSSQNHTSEEYIAREAYLGHSYRPLRSGCMLKKDNLGSITGVTTLESCMLGCTKTDGCGAAAFYEVPRRDSSEGRNTDPRLGFCQHKSSVCLTRRQAQPGRCRPLALARWKGWCAWALHREPAVCAASGGGVENVTTRWADPSLYQGEWFNNEWYRLAHNGNTSLTYLDATHLLLGGGLNNMLMHIAQLLDLSGACRPVAGRCKVAGQCTLVMPSDRPPFEPGPHRPAHRLIPSLLCAPSVLDADPLADYTPCSRLPCGKSKRALRFDAVFDFAHFAAAMRSQGCAVTMAPIPVGATRTRANGFAPLKDSAWNSTTSSMLHHVYAAARPSAAVQRLVDDLATTAKRLAGNRWAAVHLTIERDWWWYSDFCRGRRTEAFTLRCPSPSEVAVITSRRRRRYQSSGVILLYAADKVSPSGPHICYGDFGPRTFKLSLPVSVPYLFRNAAEQFLAVIAPTGFYGNSFSTMSKGVALLRAANRRKQGGPSSSEASFDRHSYTFPTSSDSPEASFAYDCAAADQATVWNKSHHHIAASHPGFYELKMAEPSWCRAKG